MSSPASAARPPPARAPTLAIVLLSVAAFASAANMRVIDPLLVQLAATFGVSVGDGLDRGHRPSCSPTACSSWCTARSATATARCRWSPSPASRPRLCCLLSALAASLAWLAAGALPDRRHRLGHHSARHRLAGRQCQLRASPGDAGPFPDRPDARPDDRRRLGRRARRLAGLALGVLGAGGDLRRGGRRPVRASCAPAPTSRVRPASKARAR